MINVINFEIIIKVHKQKGFPNQGALKCKDS